MTERLERYAEALTSDWHDAACPEGKDCRDRDLHSRGLSWPATLTKVIEQGAVIAIADAELAEQDQSWSQFHTDTTRALEAAEAEVERLRISPDRLEEMLGIDPNDPLNKLARYGVEQRRRAEDAEAEVVRHRTLHESIRARANVALVAERAKLAGTLDKVRKFAEEVRSHPPVTPTTTGEEMLSIRLQRWFADDLEAILDADPEPDASVQVRKAQEVTE